MITIQKVGEKETDIVRVIFTMPAISSCGSLYLVGWFQNEWDQSVYRMQRADDGSWFLSLELEPGCEYDFRYRTDDGTWLCDPDLPQTPHRSVSINSFIIGHDIHA